MFEKIKTYYNPLVYYSSIFTYSTYWSSVASACLYSECLLVTCEWRCLWSPVESWKRFSLTQFLLDGLQDAVGVAEHAGRSGADLDVVLSHRLTEEHGVESRYFINPHWSNAQDLCHLQEKSEITQGTRLGPQLEVKKMKTTIY